MDVASQVAVIRRGVEQVIVEAELKIKLASGRQLIVKAGFDPTAPDLHLGHTVLLRKLRQFQDLGHKVIFLIGDATALVGDPSGRSQQRRLLSLEEVRNYAHTYQAQVKRILLDHRDVFEVRYNSEWFLKISPQRRTEGLELFDFAKWVELASKSTVARLIERDDFSQRLKAGKPLSVLELFYPLMQGYDSVKIAQQYGHCDIELGGTDQTFNLLVGRDLLKEYGLATQVVLTMPLLEGLDGVQKMSKSLNNHVGIQDLPGEVYGRIMSIPDELITKYFTLLTDLDPNTIEQTAAKLASRSINPRDAKAELAATIVTMYHGHDMATAAQAEFSKIFTRREIPDHVPHVALEGWLDEAKQVKLVDLLVFEKLADSRNDARRLLKQNAVKLNGAPVTTTTIPLDQADGAVLQVGSRHFRKLLYHSPA